MPWFQEYAGSAFTWQEAAAGPSERTTPIFAVVPPVSEPADEVVEFTLQGG